MRSVLREKDVRHGGISRNGQSIEIRLRDAQQLEGAKRVLSAQFADLQAQEAADGTEFRLTASIKPEAARRADRSAGR